MNINYKQNIIENKQEKLQIEFGIKISEEKKIISND